MSDTGDIAKRLQSLGISLPEVALPAANYMPYVRSENQLVVSGQLPFLVGGVDPIGKLGASVSVDKGRIIARQCGLNILGCLAHALGNDWSGLVGCVRVGVFVASAPGFTDQPLVANGVSDLMVEVLGDAGKHARAAVGVAELPKGVAVEAEATFLLK